MANKVILLKHEQGTWVGMYLNGALETEGESLDPETTMTVLNVPFTVETRSTDWFRDHDNRCPSNFDPAADFKGQLQATLRILQGDKDAISLRIADLQKQIQDLPKAGAQAAAPKP